MSSVRSVSIPMAPSSLRSMKSCSSIATNSDVGAEDVVYPEGTEAVDVCVYKGEIIEEHYGDVDEDLVNQVVYKVVPVYNTVTKEVVKKEYIVEQKFVKVPTKKYVDTYVDKEIVREVEVIEEIPVKKSVTKHVPVIQNEEKIVTKTKYVPVEQIVEVEKVVEVAGEIIETHKVVPVEKTVYHDRHIDDQTPIVISQVVKPQLTDSGDVVKTKAKVLTPNVTSAVAAMPKPVDLVSKVGSLKTTYVRVPLSDEQYNSLLKNVNSDVSATVKAVLPFRRDVNGAERHPAVPTAFARMPEGYKLVGNTYVLDREPTSSTSTDSIASDESPVRNSHITKKQSGLSQSRSSPIHATKTPSPKRSPRKSEEKSEVRGRKRVRKTPKIAKQGTLISV